MEITERKFERELDKLLKKVENLSALVTEQLHLSQEFYATLNSDLIDRITQIELKTNKKEVNIYSKVVQYTATKQPIASNLRLIFALSKALIDLERITDEGKKSALCVQKVKEQYFENFSTNFQKVCDNNSALLQQAMQMFSQYDAAVTKNILHSSSPIKVDMQSFLKHNIELFTSVIDKQPQLLEDCLPIYDAIHCQYRIYKHIVNLVEHALYAAKGIYANDGDIDRYL